MTYERFEDLPVWQAAMKLAERIFLLPSSPLDVDGIATYEIFLRGALDKVDVEGTSNKLNVALIGTWGRALAHFDAIAGENAAFEDGPGNRRADRAIAELDLEVLKLRAVRFGGCARHVDRAPGRARRAPRRPSFAGGAAA